VEVRAPFRLDLVTRILQRLPGHPVEVRDGERYVRVFGSPAGPIAWVVRQPRPGRGPLQMTLHGAAGDPAISVTRLRRALGLDVDLGPFHRRAARVPALAPVTRFVAGVRPARFAALHEALASVIPFQQVSLASAVATLRRVVLALESPCSADGVVGWPFPDAGRLADAPEALLRAAGLSGAKVTSIRGACRAVAEGALDEAALDALPTPQLIERLRDVPGIGPWSAALVALRGFGRLDLFPPGDAAAVKLVAAAGGAEVVERLGPWRGMLYYSFFLHRALSQ
jgi:DNA-3-methyladenine glycosylase II